MLKRRSGLYFTILLVGVDALAVAMALLTAYWLRFGVEIIPVTKGYDPLEYLRIFPFAVLIWIISLNFVHLYEPRKRVFSFEAAKRIARGSFLAIFIIIGLNFLVREAEYSRPTVIMSPFIAIICLCLFRYILSKILVKIGLHKGVGMEPVFIAGTGITARVLARRIQDHPEYGYRLVGYITQNPEEVGQEIEGVPVSALMTNLKVSSLDKDVRDVMLVRPDIKDDHLVDFMLDCEKQLINVHIVPDLLEIMSTEISVNEVGGVPLFGIKESPLHGLNLIIKRLFDIFVSLFGLIISLPLMLIVTVAIKRESGSPVFYRQERIGADGHHFTMYKFRSMKKDAEKNGPVWAREGDSRCTKVGAFLRAHNLDELPQLWNVLKGDMSLVGPRPERPVFVEKFKNGIPRYMARLKVKSGITGWAQVNGLRGDSSISERVRYDMYYIENWSILFDVKILIMTLFTFH